MDHIIRLTQSPKIAAASLLLLTGSFAALAASTDTWVGGSGNNFNTTANWTYSSGSGPVATGDSLTFAGAGSTTPNNDLSGFTFANITFSSATAYTISGNSFTLGSGGSIVNSSTATQTINNNIALTGTGGTINPSGSATAAITLGGVISGSVPLTKGGVTGSTLTLSGVNTFSGALNLNAGVVIFSTPPSPSGGNLGNPSGITFGGNSTTTLQTSAGAGSVTISSPTITASGTSSTASFKNGGAAGTIYEVSARITGTGNARQSSPATSGAIVRFSNDTSDYTGTFTMGASILEFTSLANPSQPSSLGAGSTSYAINNGGSGATFRYVGSGNVTTTRNIDWQATTGPLTLDSSGSGSVQFLGSANIKSGSGVSSLVLRGTSTGANVLAQPIVENGGAINVTKNDAGSWTLAGANNYSGGTTLSGGTLALSGSGTLGAPTSILNINGASGTTLDLGGSSQTVGAVTASQPTVIQNGTMSGASYTFNVASSALVTANLTGGNLTLSGLGTLYLFGQNTYNTTTISSGGTLVVTNDSGLGSNLAVSMSGNNSTLAATNNGAAVTNTVTIKSTRTITAGPGITASFATLDTNNLFIAAKITGSGSVTKKSSGFNLGTVRFSNDANDYSGDFTAGFGNTEFTSVADQGTASSLGAGATATGGKITINNATSSGTLRYVGSGNSVTHRPLSWSGTSGTYTLDASGAGTVQFLNSSALRTGTGGNEELRIRGTNTGLNTLAAVINDLSGTTWVNKFDTGTWVLSGANTFTGNVTNSGGILQVNAAETPGVSGPLGVNGALWFAGGTLQYSSGNNADYSGRFSTGANQAYRIDCNGRPVTFASPLTSAGGALTLSSAAAGGVLTLTGTNTYTGNTTINSGALAIAGAGSISNSPVITVSSGSSLDVSGANGGAYTLANAQSLKGNGVVLGNLVASAGATIAPGTTIGTLTFGSAPVVQGTLAMDINKTSGTTTSDRLAVTNGTLAYGGTLTVALLGGSDALTGGESFTLFAAPAYSGAFAATNLPSLTSGLNWFLGNLAVDGTALVNRAPLGQDKTYTRAKGVSLKIQKADLLAGASDPDSGDSVSFDAVTSNGSQGATVTQDVTTIYYQPANDNADSLQFRLKDTRGGSVVKNLQIDVSVVTGQVQTITISNGTAQVGFAGIPGFGYDVQRSTNLVVWATIATTNAPGGGVFDVTDTFADLGSAPASAFYRLRQQ